MNVHNRMRGVLSANLSTPVSIMSEVQNSVEDFKRHHAGELKNMTRSIDELNAQMAAYKIGGGGDGTGANFDRNRANNAVVEFMRTGQADAMQALVPRAAMTTDSGPDGGFTVPVEIDRTIQSQLVATSPMRYLANVVLVATSDYRKIINRRGATSGWVGETDDRPETATPALASIEPPMGEVYANPMVSQWALDDSAFDLGEFLYENVVEKFATDEAAAFITGNGMKKPLGFLSVGSTEEEDDVRQFGKFQFMKSGNASGFATTNPADALIDLVFKLRAPYRAGRGVGWLMNSRTAGIVMKFKDIGGNYIWQYGLIDGQPPKLCGYPVYMDENMPDIGANAFPIAFGDFNKAYIIVDRMGIRLIRDPFTKPGWVKFYMTKRVGGAPADTNAVKLLKIAA